MAGSEGGTALLVVDVQNDFADPQGSLYVRGGEAVVPPDRTGRCRGARPQALRSSIRRTGTPPSTPHFPKDGGIWPVHCVQGTWGAEFHPGL